MMFRKKMSVPRAVNNITCCCAVDRMVGIGSGARYYTQGVHYSTEYGVGRKGVKNIINASVQETDDAFGQVHYGIQLPSHDQKRRYVIKSALHGNGLDLDCDNHRFVANALDEFPEPYQLLEAGMATDAGGTIRLT